MCKNMGLPFCNPGLYISTNMSHLTRTADIPFVILYHDNTIPIQTVPA